MQPTILRCAAYCGCTTRSAQLEIMNIHIGEHKIELSNESNYKKDSIDNTFDFDCHYFDGQEYEFSTQIGIKVFKNDNLIKSAIISACGGVSRIHGKSQVVNEERIVICCSNQIFSLSIPSLNLNWQTKADEATCISIFELNRDFIIHGELEISRISNGGKIIWQRMGADIFTTLEGKEDDFKLTDKYIFVTDWENRKYQFDFNGNEVK